MANTVPTLYYTIRATLLCLVFLCKEGEEQCILSRYKKVNTKRIRGNKNKTLTVQRENEDLKKNTSDQSKSNPSNFEPVVF